MTATITTATTTMTTVSAAAVENLQTSPLSHNETSETTTKSTPSSAPHQLLPAASPPSPPPSPPPPDLDPRIQIELENLNTATDNINRLEIELEEANATFRILLNESTRRLKVLSKKLGACIDKSRPFHEAVDKARLAQIECQTAAVQFQRAHEHYAAAKETVALAEQRFMSGSHEWQFDNAWQEMLNHATIKVAAAEQHKTECNAEHQRRAAVFSAAEVRTSQLEDQLRRSVVKSRPYFEEKQICQDQLQTQKERIEELQQCVAQSKRRYAQALKALEQISEEIHRARKQQAVGTIAARADDEDDEESEDAPQGPREPGVGAERCSTDEMTEMANKLKVADVAAGETLQLPSLNYVRELDAACVTGGDNDVHCDNHADDMDDGDRDDDKAANAETAHNASTNDVALEALRLHVKQLAVRPMEGGDGQQTQDVWESELNATVDRLDRLLMQREHESSEVIGSSTPGIKLTMRPQLAATLQPHSDAFPVSMPNTPVRRPTTASPVRQLMKADPLPASNVSMRELPLLSRLSNELTATGQRLAAAAAAANGGAVNTSGTAVVATTMASWSNQGAALQQRRRSLE